ncbi:hypothetical protein A167_01205 [Alcanivorax sp. S71-1-4]|uniref:ankyrin repeat domain-containing protein n=1 Tax=Alcanivorax sp. S71-1-4 TaxID=1177159 RepID=UPI00135C3249|nr:ankyrin repeat domain-containing protein [Alcanivorax sp. S71-1-4]KAF0810174.1 hypothetical protein A167_01205 [Alcanivorax sp. S71-1-4]
MAMLCLLATPAGALTPDELVPWLPNITAGELQHQLGTLPDINAPDASGLTLLDHALCSAPALVPTLLDAGADPARRDARGAQALHRLFRCGHAPDDTRAASLVDLLLAQGLDPNDTDHLERTPLHAALMLLGEGRGDIHLYRDGALLLLARGADATAPDNAGLTPLHLAASEHDGRITSLMLDTGTPPDLRDAAGRTPLWYAARGDDNLAPFQLLLEAGANAAAPGLRERVLAASVPAKTALLSGYLPDWRLPVDTAFQQIGQGLRAGLPAASLDRLHQSSAEPDALANRLAEAAPTLLPALTRAGLGPQADWLITHALPATGQSASTALLAFAVEHGDLALARRLLDAGTPPADPATLMHLALATERLPLIQLLAGHLPGRHQLAPWLLHYLASGGHQPAVVEWLLLDGADIDARDAHGNTAVMLAARDGHTELVPLLLAHGAETSAVNHSGCDLACYYHRDDAGAELPTLTAAPGAFYLLAFGPALLLYFALAARQLHRHRPLARLTLGLAAGLAVALGVSASLFYECAPCLATGDQPLWLTGAGATLLAALAMGWALRQR